MTHPLDNPAWSALNSGNKQLAFGNDNVKFFDAEVSPFVGFNETSANNFAELHRQIKHNAPVIYISPVETEIPDIWKVARIIRGFQMVYGGDAQPVASSVNLLPLTHQHIPQMLALTKLTNPGPFASRTIDFGHYQGIFDDDKLVAMAGQRLHAFEYAEISAVCTHPDHLGKGYAKQLLLHQVQRIKAAAGVPYLHVRYDNPRAIQVYESLGFYTRIEVYFYVMVKL